MKLIIAVMLLMSVHCLAQTMPSSLSSGNLRTATPVNFTSQPQTSIPTGSRSAATTAQRADAEFRYYTQAESDSLFLSTSFTPVWPLAGTPTTFTPSAHTHPWSDIVTNAAHQFVSQTQIDLWNSKTTANANAGSAGGVSSVNGQTGAVTVSVPTVPTQVSAFTNDAGYTTTAASLSASRQAIADSTQSITFGAGFTLITSGRSTTVTIAATGAGRLGAEETVGVGEAVSAPAKAAAYLTSAGQQVPMTSAVDTDAAQAALVASLTGLTGFGPNKLLTTDASGKLSWITLTTPNAPSGLTAPLLSATLIGTSQVKLSWTTADKALSYQLQRDTTSLFFSPVTLYSGSATTFPNTDLPASTQYYYRIQATAPGGANSPYATATVTTPSLVAP